MRKHVPFLQSAIAAANATTPPAAPAPPPVPEASRALPPIGATDLRALGQLNRPQRRALARRLRKGR